MQVEMDRRHGVGAKRSGTRKSIAEGTTLGMLQLQGWEMKEIRYPGGPTAEKGLPAWKVYIAVKKKIS